MSMQRQHDIKNGYTQLAHTLLEDMAQMDLTSMEFRVIMWVWRNSYGVHHKSTRPVSEREMARSMGTNPGNVHRALESLKKRDLVRQKVRSYSFNKYAVGVAGRQHLNVINPLITMKRCPAATGALPGGNGGALPSGNGALPGGNASNVILKDRGVKDRGSERSGKTAAPPAPVPSGSFSRTEIEAVGLHYISVKKLPMADDGARQVYAKMRNVWDPARKLLTLASGNVERVKEAISDLDAYYAGKPWTLSWVATDYPEWDKERMENDEKKEVRK